MEILERKKKHHLFYHTSVYDKAWTTKNNIKSDAIFRRPGTKLIFVAAACDFYRKEIFKESFAPVFIGR